MRETRTATIMFTDLVASTARASRVGPARSDEMRRDHFALVRRVLADHRGTEVKTLGDGVMGAFDSVAEAVNAAAALQQSLEAMHRTNPDAPGLRVGLSVGEVTEEAGDVFGTAVVEAARICAEAGSGQILCAGVVRSLAEGHCRHGFRSAGSRTLKGLPVPTALEEVIWEPLVESGLYSNFAQVDSRSLGRAVNMLDLQHSPDVLWRTPLLAEVRDRILERLAPAPGQVLLDLGCGAGHEVLQLAEVVGADGAVIGIDKSPELVEEATRRAAEAGVTNVEFRVGDAQDLPLEDRCVDGARSDRVFQYLADPARAVRELRRVTRPGGAIVVADTDWGASAFDCDDLELAARVDEAWTATRPSGRVGRQLHSLFVKAGLADVRIVPHCIAATVGPQLGAGEAAGFLETILQAFAGQAAEAGAVTVEEASRWLALQHAAIDDGRFFRFLAMFVVSGRAPES